MMNSVFRKLLFVFLSISLISLIGLSVLISVFLDNKLRLQKENEMREHAKYISTLVIRYNKDEILFHQLKKELNTIEILYNIRSTIIKNPNHPKRLLQIGLSMDAMNWAKKVYDGDQTAYIGPFESNGQDLLVLGFPIKSKDLLINGIFLSTPIADLDALRQAMNQLIITAFAVIAPTIGIVIYWISKRLVRPINQMSLVVGEIARGHFYGRVPVHGNDEMARLAKVFNQLAGQIHQIEKNRSRFVSEVAHELRTPLTTVFGTIRGVLDGTLEGDDQKEFLAIAVDELNRLNRLVNHLLDLSRFEEHSASLNRVEVDFSELTRQTIRMFTDETTKLGIEIYESIEPNIQFHTDPDRMKQVLVNLIHNAIIHNPKCTFIAISLSLSKATLTLSISDSGKGIPEEDLPHIFERFYKSDTSRSRSGSGLGLTICKSIVEMLGGSIFVASSSKGTTFTIELPQ